MKSKLYLIKKSLYSSPSYETFKNILSAQKNKKNKIGIALIEDSVTALTGKIGQELNEICDNQISVYALEEDIKARGLKELIKIKNTKIITYRELINLILNEYEHLINYL